HTPPPSWFGAGAFGLLMNALVCVRKAVLAVLRTETREFTEAAALAVTLVKSKLRPKKLPEAFPEHWAKAPEELDTTSTSALPPRSSVLAALLVVSIFPLRAVQLCPAAGLPLPWPPRASCKMRQHNTDFRQGFPELSVAPQRVSAAAWHACNTPYPFPQAEQT